MTNTNGPRVPDALINALITVESGGRDDAVGDGGKALGALQIHEILVRDVNRILDLHGGTGVRFVGLDRANRESSIAMLRIYLAHYATPARLGREPTLEDMARMWNGGPGGWKQAATLPYWQKVRRQLAREVFVGPDTLVGGLRVDAPVTSPILPAQAPKPPVTVKLEDLEPGPLWTGPDHVAAGRDIATGQFNSRAYREAEEREAWDRYLVAAYTVNQRATAAANTADALLAERRKRFPVEGAS